MAKSLTKQNPSLNDDLMGVYMEEQRGISASLGKEVEIHLWAGFLHHTDSKSSAPLFGRKLHGLGPYLKVTQHHLITWTKI